MSSSIKQITAWVVLSGGLATLSLGLTQATAAAQPAPMVCQDGSTTPSPTNSCTYQWCPGSPEMKHMPDWDRSVCHPWYFDENSPLTDSIIIEGFPPPRPPSLQCIPILTCRP
ncbi:hypothetical protein [Mycobacterium asiaticum]|uniref:hypothetical protein n=1 Tax=Mycobacterium asiaticum TaxID=1790 RepID=UPI0012DB2E66|nr:hypothetical protein [Mycobacterium asiaticum]